MAVAAKTVKYRSADRAACLNTRSKSSARVRRWPRGNLLWGLAPVVVECPGLQGVKRARPLARRRLITARPALVAIRALNPCVRLRFKFEGWKVRFMADDRAKRVEYQRNSPQNKKMCLAAKGGNSTRAAFECQ